MSLRGVNGSFYIEDEFFEDHKHLRTFSMESKILRETFHYVEPIAYSYSETDEITNWCYKTFGSPGYRIDTRDTVWDFTSSPSRFWFSDEKNLTLFILRWS